jgi:hypothetical protein
MSYGTYLYLFVWMLWISVFYIVDTISMRGMIFLNSSLNLCLVISMHLIILFLVQMFLISKLWGRL